MQPIYKKETIAVEYCPKCEEKLKGYGTVLIPWRCKCGVWVEKENKDIDYIVIKHAAIEDFNS